MEKFAMFRHMCIPLMILKKINKKLGKDLLDPRYLAGNFS